MPAITDDPGRQRLPGKIVWHELITDTPDESRHFYEELFRWKFKDLGINLGFTRTVNYTLIRHQGKLIGGLIDQNLLATKADISQWMVLLSVEDVDAATRHVESSGGTVFNPPTDLAERGRMSIVADSQGAMLALLETRGGDPADVAEVAVGGFCGMNCGPMILLLPPGFIRGWRSMNIQTGSWIWRAVVRLTVS